MTFLQIEVYLYCYYYLMLKRYTMNLSELPTDFRHFLNTTHKAVKRVLNFETEAMTLSKEGLVRVPVIRRLNGTHVCTIYLDLTVGRHPIVPENKTYSVHCTNGVGKFIQITAGDLASVRKQLVNHLRIEYYE